MSEEHERESGRGGMLWWVLLTFLPLLYVLSIGPVAGLARNKPAFIEPIRAFYYPVIWLHDHTPLEKPLEAYVRLWGVS